MDVNSKDNRGEQAVWICGCGKENRQRFCYSCGKPRPEPELSEMAGGDDSNREWTCTGCGTLNRDRFCIRCGQSRAEAKTDAPSAATYVGAAVPTGQEASFPPPEEQTSETVFPPPEEQTLETVSLPPEEQTLETVFPQPPVAETFQEKQEAGPSSRSGKMKFVIIGIILLVLALAAWFFFFPKGKAVRSDGETTKVADEVKTEQSEKTGKAPVVPDAGQKEAKLKEYAENVKQAAENLKQEAVSNQKIVFMVENVQQSGTDLIVTGRFFNGKKDRTITAVKEMEFDVILRDVETVVADLKSLRSEKPCPGLKLNPMETTDQLRITLVGKAPSKPFNNFSAKGHHIHWEGTGR